MYFVTVYQETFVITAGLGWVKLIFSIGVWAIFWIHA